MEFESRLQRAREIRKRIRKGEIPKAIAIDLGCSVDIVYRVKQKKIFKGYI